MVSNGIVSNGTVSNAIVSNGIITMDSLDDERVVPEGPSVIIIIIIIIITMDSPDDEGVVPEGPAILGVRLLDVDQLEVGQVPVGLRHAVELAQLDHERGSATAPEVQHLETGR